MKNFTITQIYNTFLPFTNFTLLYSLKTAYEHNSSELVSTQLYTTLQQFNKLYTQTYHNKTSQNIPTLYNTFAKLKQSSKLLQKQNITWHNFTHMYKDNTTFTTHYKNTSPTTVSNLTQLYNTCSNLYDT